MYINASNVTLKRSRVTSGAFYAIQVASGRTGVVIEDVEVNGTGKSSGNCGIAGPATVTRANIYGVENGVVPYADPSCETATSTISWHPVLRTMTGSRSTAATRTS